ncbi:MAG: zinc metallopeptidase [Clostridia bacterium]|nr:zinc metallopeptidase [Clostridia bacterium]
MYWIEYFLYMLPAYLLVLIIQIVLKSTVSKYSNVKTNMCGAAAAELVLRKAGVAGVNIGLIKGDLTDNYDPSSSVIHLSDRVYSVSSVTAVGIAAHEAGHAVQYAEDYGPAKLRQATVKVCNIGSRLAIPLIFAGIVFAIKPLAIAGVACFLLVILFQLVTLPVEFNASKRAVTILSESGELTEEELKGVKKVLTAAAMTYVGSLAVSTMQLLYYVTRIKRR